MKTMGRARMWGELAPICAGRVLNVPTSTSFPPGDARGMTPFLHKGPEVA